MGGKLESVGGRETNPNILYFLILFSIKEKNSNNTNNNENTEEQMVLNKDETEIIEKDPIPLFQNICC